MESIFKFVQIIAGLAAIYYGFTYRVQIKKFVEEVIAELKKVTWTTRQDLTNATFIVIAASVCLGLFITVVDLIMSRGLNLLMR